MSDAPEAATLPTDPILPPQPPAAPPLQPFVCPWNLDMAKAPHDGSLVLLTESLMNEDGVRAVWYIALGTARPWAKAKQGWLDAQLRRWVPFEPAGWALPGQG